MEKGKEEIPKLLYLYIHSKIFERTKGRETPIGDIIDYLFEWKIPKKDFKKPKIKVSSVISLTKKKKRRC